MSLGQERQQMRYYFFEAWRKQRLGQPLEPLEKVLVSVIERHPEYHSLLTNPDTLEQDYTPDKEMANPFLHLGMHIAIQEQLSTDRPAGIVTTFHRLCQRIGDPHAVEHRMMECLGEILWQAQRDGTYPDESLYRQQLKRLTR